MSPRRRIAPPKKRKPAPKKAPAKVVEQPLDPWDRQSDESEEAYESFLAYRDQGLGHRSIRQVGRTLNRNRTSLGEWSSKHRWVARVAAWDLHLDRIRQEELKQEQIAAARRHATILRGHLQALAAPLEEMLSRIQTDPQALKGMSRNDLLKIVVAAARATPRLVQAERLTLGVSTENVGGHDGGPLLDATKLPDSELDAFLLGVDAGKAAEAEQATTEKV